MQVLLQERLSGRASPMFTGRIAGAVVEAALIF